MIKNFKNLTQNLLKKQKITPKLKQITNKQINTFITFQPKTYNINLQNQLQLQQQKYQFSTTDNKEYQEEIQTLLSQVKLDFLENSDLVSQNYIVSMDISNDGKVTIYLKLDKNFRKLRTHIKMQLKQIPWIKELQITMASEEQEKKQTTQGGLVNVKKIIAVYSCKGGVGKSTVSVNLACTLQKQGKKVGIFDADVYGPSLPTLVGKEGSRLYSPKHNKSLILPVLYEDLKTMSYGYASTEKAVKRGPQISGIVRQLITTTEWGDLDYLIVDMPPGTGDIQLTLCQDVKFDGVVMVTTPQKISHIDVVKGIQMFDQLKVPTIAIVENMSEYVCKKCKKVHKIFGQGYLKSLSNQFGINNSVSLPIFNYLALCSDSGQPAMNSLPQDHSIYQTFLNLGQLVQQELVKLENITIPTLETKEINNQQVFQVIQDEQIVKTITAKELRNKCQCANCVDEFTGDKILKESQIKDDIKAEKIIPTGNYAVSIHWNDGHQTSIYPYDTILSDKVIAMDQQ